jgi:hypothetical protein
MVTALDDDGVAQLDVLLSEYTSEIRALAYTVLTNVDARLVGATRMVYGNWNATVVGYSPDGKSRHAVCSVAVYRRWVNLFFFVGPELPDPHGLLTGSGSTVRGVRITNPTDLDDRVVALLDDAVNMWPWKFDSHQPTTTAIVSVSDKRRSRMS